MNNLHGITEKVFEKTDMRATRDGFGEALLQLGESNKDVVVVCADLAESTRTIAFKEKYPERYIEVGVAEQNLAAVASGMASYGKIPFITSYSAFNPGRNNEQIRTTIALNDVPVKICGMHAGISVGPDGATHQALEDMALMRALPNMTVISPCDAIEARKAVLEAVTLGGPVYLRFGREKTPVMTTDTSPFSIGKVNVVWDEEKPEVAIIATGPLLFEALKAAKALEKEMKVVVLNVHTIKPLDVEAVVSVAKRAGAVVTVEEHQVMGGMGSAVAECLAENFPVPIEFVGVADRFGQSGTMTELLLEYGLDATFIAAKVRKVKLRK